MKYVPPAVLLVLAAVLLANSRFLGLYFAFIGLVWVVGVFADRHRAPSRDERLSFLDRLFRTKRTAPRLVVLLALVLGSFGALYYGVLRDPSPKARPDYTPFLAMDNVYTGFSGLEDRGAFCLSPDERWLIYSAFRGDGPLYVDTLDVYVYDLRSDKTRRVDLTRSGSTPERIANHLGDTCWVDGRLAVAVSTEGGRRECVMILPVDATAQKTVFDDRPLSVSRYPTPARKAWPCQTPPARRETNNSLEVQAWDGTSAGTSVFMGSRHGEKQKRRVAILRRIDEDGNEFELARKESNRTGWEIHDISVSPNERYVAYLAQEYSDWDTSWFELWPVGPTQDRRLFVVDTSTGEERPFGAIDDFNSPTWTQDGTALYFLERRKGFCRIRLGAEG